jgi:hypothetical protein
MQQTLLILILTPRNVCSNTLRGSIIKMGLLDCGMVYCEFLYVQMIILGFSLCSVLFHVLWGVCSLLMTVTVLS